MTKRKLYMFCRTKLEENGQRIEFFTKEFWNDFCEYEKLFLLSIKDNAYTGRKNRYLKQSIFTSSFFENTLESYIFLTEIEYENRELFRKTLGL